MKFNSFFTGSITTLLIVGICAGLFRSCEHPTQTSSEEKVEVDRDTIPLFIDTPAPRDSVVLRYEKITIPVQELAYENNADTLVVDSVSIELPITQKIYQDSTYQAWVSGYKPELDSIRIFQPVTTITRTITNTEVKYKAKRWGIGVQAGIGVTPTKVEPYIGVGVTYNIFSW